MIDPKIQEMTMIVLCGVGWCHATRKSSKLRGLGLWACLVDEVDELQDYGHSQVTDGMVALVG